MTGAIGLRRLAAASAILLLTTALQMALPFAAHPVSAATVTPIVVDGNPTCQDFDAEGTMLKIEGSGELDGGDSGTHSAGDLHVTVSISSTDLGSVFDWASSQPIDVVVAKGGPMADVYVYGGASGDTGLHAPVNTSGEQYYGLSHISFCTGDATTTTTASTTTTTNTTAPRTETTAVPLGAIGDYVWLDLDKDGAQGDPGDEKPVEGATVQLLAADGTLLASQLTGPDGLYLFDRLPAGNYRVQVVYQGATYTIPRAPGVSAGANSDVDPLGNGVGRTGIIDLSTGEIDLTWDAGIVLEVLGVQIESTATTAVVEPVTLDTLPFTGSQDGRLLWAAALMAIVGAAALILTAHRAEHDRTTASMTGWADAE